MIYDLTNSLLHIKNLRLFRFVVFHILTKMYSLSGVFPYVMIISSLKSFLASIKKSPFKTSYYFRNGRKNKSILRCYIAKISLLVTHIVSVTHISIPVCCYPNELDEEGFFFGVLCLSGIYHNYECYPKELSK
jgi:hypothetical protein